MAQRRFLRFVTQDRDRLPRHRSRANETRESESGFFLAFDQKKISSDQTMRKPRHLKPNPDGSSVDRFGRAALERSFFSSLKVLESARSLICTGCFRDFCVADQSPSLDKFYRSGCRGPKRAREAAGAAYRRTQGTSDPTSPSIDPSPRSSSTARAPSVSPPRTPPGPAPPDAPLR